MSQCTVPTLMLCSAVWLVWWLGRNTGRSTIVKVAVATGVVLFNIAVLRRM